MINFTRGSATADGPCNMLC